MQPLTSPRRQYSIFELLLATTWFAVAIALTTSGWTTNVCVGLFFLIFYVALATCVPTDIPSKETQALALKRFQRRQTTGQRIAAYSFGVVLPIICCIFDPIVFTDVAVRFSLFSYAVIVGQMALLVVWKLCGARFNPRWQAVFGGGMLMGGVFALLLAIVLTPLSLLGMLAVIGILGFTPWATMAVFVGHARDALRLAQSELGSSTARVWATAMLVPITLLWVLNFSPIGEYIIERLCDVSRPLRL